MKKNTKVKTAPVEVKTKLDLGCGKNKVSPDFLGVDIMNLPGVDYVYDLTKPWPWKDSSIDEVHCSHFIEHLTPTERIHFVNELYRVLKPGAKAAIIAPHWSSCRAYGDLTHVWPPISEFWFYYLDSKWREVNAPHNTFYKCNFSIGWGYGMDKEIEIRNQDFQQMAIRHWKDAITDIVATFTKV